MTDPHGIVFVVDDDVSVRRAVARLLKSAGHRVETYASGREFLDAAARRPGAGCVVLDVRMPGMSGFDVIESLAGRGTGALPVILITGDGDERTATRARNAGCSSFLAKPFDDDALLDAIQRALAKGP
jgi:FixJ family two-component response regulator